MPTWTDTRPMPSVPTVDGLHFGGYMSELTRTFLEGFSTARYVIDDPRSEWYGVVMTTPGFATRWIIGNAAGVVESRVTWDYPFSTATTVAHLITWHVFKAAREAGTTGQYWNAA